MPGTLIVVSAPSSLPGAPPGPGWLPRPRSPLARAVLPVVGGALLIALIFAATWGIAAWSSRGDAQPSDRLAPSMLKVGGVAAVADTIDHTGPILFPGLNTSSGERTIVLAHEGDDPQHGWHAYWAYPADADPSCGVTQVQETERFTDCRGRQLGVADLALPEGVCPLVDDGSTLYLDLTCGATTPTTA